MVCDDLDPTTSLSLAAPLPLSLFASIGNSVSGWVMEVRVSGWLDPFPHPLAHAVTPLRNALAQPKACQ